MIVLAFVAEDPAGERSGSGISRLCSSLLAGFASFANSTINNKAKVNAPTRTREFIGNRLSSWATESCCSIACCVEWLALGTDISVDGCASTS